MLELFCLVTLTIQNTMRYIFPSGIIQRFICTQIVLTGILSGELNGSWCKYDGRLSGKLHAYSAIEVWWVRLLWKTPKIHVVPLLICLGQERPLKDWMALAHTYKILKLMYVVNDQYCRERRTKLKFPEKFYLHLSGRFLFPGSLERLNWQVSRFVNDKSYWKTFKSYWKPFSMTCLSLKRIKKNLGLVRLQYSNVITNHTEAV